MSNMEANFSVAAQLQANFATKVQSTVRLLADNTSTQITLSNPNAEANRIDFELTSGSMDDVDKACSYNGITRDGNTLTIQD